MICWWFGEFWFWSRWSSNPECCGEAAGSGASQAAVQQADTGRLWQHQQQHLHLCPGSYETTQPKAQGKISSWQQCSSAWEWWCCCSRDWTRVGLHSCIWSWHHHWRSSSPKLVMKIHSLRSLLSTQPSTLLSSCQNTLKSTLPSAWYYLLYPQLVSSFGCALIGVISFGAN